MLFKVGVRRKVELAGAVLYRGNRIDDRVGITSKQLAADQQHEIIARVCVVTELALVGPLDDSLDVSRATACRCIPELAEESAALVGGIVAPQKLAVHLYIQAYQKRLDEFRICFQKRDCVRGNFIQTGKQKVLRQIAKRFVHRLRKVGRVQQRFQRVSSDLSWAGD